MFWSSACRLRGGEVVHQRLGQVDVEREEAAALGGPQRLEQPLLQPRVEADHVAACRRAVRRDDRPGRAPPRAASTRPSRSLVTRARERQRLEDPDQVADRDLSSSSACSTRWISPRLSRAGVSSSTTTGWVRLTDVGEQLDVLAAEQPRGVAADDLGEVGGDHRGPVDDGGAADLGLAAQLGRDPLGGQAEDRLLVTACRAARRGRRRSPARCPGGASPRATSTPKSRIA